MEHPDWTRPKLLIEITEPGTAKRIYQNSNSREMSDKEPKKTLMDQKAKARVAAAADGDVKKGSHEARMQSAADKNQAEGKTD